MIWTILGAILPWSSLALAGGLFWYARQARKATARLAERDAQLREVAGQRDALKAEVYTHRLASKHMEEQFADLQNRLNEATERAAKQQTKAADIALQIAQDTLSNEQAFAQVMDLVHGRG